ncbi:hypothetical protein V8C86DRAFT_3205669 [Haematococcus lacustris]
MLRRDVPMALRPPPPNMLVRSRFVNRHPRLIGAIDYCRNRPGMLPWSDRVHYAGAPTPTVHFFSARLETVHMALNRSQHDTPHPGGSAFEIIKGHQPCPPYFDIDMFIPPFNVDTIQALSPLSQEMARAVGLPFSSAAIVWLRAMERTVDDELTAYGHAWLCTNMRLAMQRLLHVRDVGVERMCDSTRQHKFSVHIMYPDITLEAPSTSGVGLAAEVGVALLIQAIKEVKAFATSLHGAHPSASLPVAHVWAIKMLQLHRHDDRARMSWRKGLVTDTAPYCHLQQFRVCGASKLNADHTYGPCKRVRSMGRLWTRREGCWVQGLHASFLHASTTIAAHHESLAHHACGGWQSALGTTWGLTIMKMDDETRLATPVLPLDIDPTTGRTVSLDQMMGMLEGLGFVWYSDALVRLANVTPLNTPRIIICAPSLKNLHAARDHMLGPRPPGQPLPQYSLVLDEYGQLRAMLSNTRLLKSAEEMKVVSHTLSLLSACAPAVLAMQYRLMMPDVSDIMERRQEPMENAKLLRFDSKMWAGQRLVLTTNEGMWYIILAILYKGGLDPSSGSVPHKAPIIIHCNYQKTATGVYAWLRKLVKEEEEVAMKLARIVLLTAGPLRNPNAFAAGCDVLICTYVIQAGVSFTAVFVHRLAYIGGVIGSLDDAVQAVGRRRMGAGVDPNLYLCTSGPNENPPDVHVVQLASRMVDNHGQEDLEIQSACMRAKREADFRANAASCFEAYAKANNSAHVRITSKTTKAALADIVSHTIVAALRLRGAPKASALDVVAATEEVTLYIALPIASNCNRILGPPPARPPSQLPLPPTNPQDATTAAP